MNSKWNIIGQPYNHTLPIGELLVLYNGTYYPWENATSDNNEEDHPLLLPFIYEWNAATQMYSISPTYIPSKGYWMYAYHNCTLIQPTPSEPSIFLGNGNDSPSAASYSHQGTIPHNPSIQKNHSIETTDNTQAIGQRLWLRRYNSQPH